MPLVDTEFLGPLIDDGMLSVLAVADGAWPAVLISELGQDDWGGVGVEVVFLDSMERPVRGIASHARLYGHPYKRTIWPAEWLMSFIGRFDESEFVRRSQAAATVESGGPLQ